MTKKSDQYSAPQQALGYMYQPRYALYHILTLPENTTCLIEADDDISSDSEDGKLLLSLKHKAPGDTLTDLSPDFWKSVRIWTTYAASNPNSISETSFFLITTGQIQENSFLSNFSVNSKGKQQPNVLSKKALTMLGKSKAKLLKSIHGQLTKIDPKLLDKVFANITIFDSQNRIDEIPSKIMDQMRTVRPQFREPVFQQLEGWWNDECVKIMTKKRLEPLIGAEVSEMLANISEQFRDDNLPLDFFNAEPEEGIDPEKDNRTFVHQLRAIGLSSNRIRRAILDYYRAYEQRSSWARKNITITGEVAKYDDRLIDEWERFKEIVLEDINENSSEDLLREAGRKIYNGLTSGSNANLRIRPMVTEPYVMVGSFHMLANEPTPRVYWHPLFLDRIAKILEVAEK